MKRTIDFLQHRALQSSLATSAALHALLLMGALFGWNMARQNAFPVDAVEVAVGDFMIQAGVKRAAQVGRALPKPVASALDLSVAKKKEETKPEPAAAEAETSAGSVGEGGQSTASAGQAASEWDSYRVRLRQRILESLIYPRTSKNLGETGQVTVKLNVLRDGTISDIKVAEPSAFERLNLAAVDTVKRVAHLDPLPTSYTNSQYSALVPIDFALK